MTGQQIAVAKIAIASATALLLLWGWWLRRAGTPERCRRQRDAVLLALGLCGAVGWWNFLQLPASGYVHAWDAYHYFMGAKYFSELGYTRLYTCTVIADAEEGLGPEQRKVRDLETNHIVRGHVMLARPEVCTAHFSPARWTAFKQDLRWFRGRLSATRWAQMQRDHGYNATPTWGIVGMALASSGPASRPRLVALALLDPLLLVGMWVAVCWAFGWRAACVALVYWGTNFPARSGWTGGSILRHDWLVLAILGLCLLRRGRPTAAGISLAWAACLRIFPMWLLGGVALKVIGRWWRWRSRALTPAHVRFGVGAAVAGALLVSAGAWAAGGWHAWIGFKDNSVKHVTSPSTNRMGLAAMAAYAPDRALRQLQGLELEDDPHLVWMDARRRVFEERRVLFAVAVLALVALVTWAARAQADWVAAILGVGLIPVVGEVASYYFAILLAYGLLADRREGIGAGLCALSAVGGILAQVLRWNDELYMALSATTLAFVLAVTVVLGWRPVPDAAEPGEPADADLDLQGRAWSERRPQSAGKGRRPSRA